VVRNSVVSQFEFPPLDVSSRHPELPAMLWRKAFRGQAMVGAKIQTYQVAIVVNPATAQETTRASGEVAATNDDEAVEKGIEWSNGKAHDGDYLQVVHNGRGVRSIELRVLP